MILDIDAGNSFVKWRVMDGSNLVARGAKATEEVMAGRLTFDAVDTLTQARLSSVANQDLAKALQKQIQKQFEVALQIARVSENVAGVSCGYTEPDTLGIDRWLASIAAYQRYSRAVLVVDAGSAITIDLVGPQGEHLGGYITPGLALMHEALWKGTDKVQVKGEDPLNMLVPGVCTHDAVNRGCLLAAVAMIEKLASQYPASIVITGGDAKALVEAISLPSDHQPDLVLEGLAVGGVELTGTIMQ